jgi:hypothetical protein
MKFLKDLLAALAFAVIYFVTDQYWLHKNRTVGANLTRTVIATVCFFVIAPMIRKWRKQRKARATGE